MSSAATTVMLQEILEQPAAISRTLASIRPLSTEVRRLARGRQQVLFAARGSSSNAATYGRYLCEVIAGRAAGPVAPSVATAYQRKVDLTHALVVSVSQSGETTELVETQEWARSCGAATLAVTNVHDSSLALGADLTLVTAASHERAVPATKTFTTQLIAMAVLAGALAPSAREEGELDSVADAVATVIQRRAGVEEAVGALSARSRALVTSRGPAVAAAAELALKLEETCLRPVRGLSYADLRHGPMAIVDDQMAAVVLAPHDGPLLGGIASCLRELSDRGAAVVAIGGDDQFAAQADVAVPGADLSEWLAPIGLVVAGQLVVEAFARALGLDPDAPRGLRKVTQTDLAMLP